MQLIPNHVIVLLKRLGIAVLMLFLTRIIFLVFNTNSFNNVSIQDFSIGLWFDMITVGLFFFPFYTLFLLPIPLRETKAYRLFFKILFQTTNILLIAFNLIDVEYFKYTSKRSTFDLFSMMGKDSDLGQLATTFISDFWYLFIFLGLLIVLSLFLYKKTESKQKSKQESNFYLKNSGAFIVLISILIIISRGGFSLKPVGIIEAFNYTKGKNTSLVLTTPFTIIKTIDQGNLELVEYFPEGELSKLFNPIKTSQPQHILPDRTNVMIIVLESFGIEFIGEYNNNNGYTPFLDSLMKESLTFDFAFANGKKSIEAIPAIIASMPSLMENPYISSPFGDNEINTLPNILKKHGYSSAFFHAATNGSMRFDGFAQLSGYDKYFGRTEYNNEDHFDQTWGILDEYFNPWTAKQLSNLKEPFFSTLFTISSHHPYYIPEHMKGKVKKGPQKICASISYADYSLKKFFEEAKKQPWYNNTLFVLLADHTPSSKTKIYNTRTHMYKTPIMFYHPKGYIKPKRSNKLIQQLDILPTILDLLNIQTDYYAFGNSLYQNTNRESLAYISGSYYYYNGNHMTTIVEGKARFLYDFTDNSLPAVDSLSFYKEEATNNENRVKAIIQTYSRDLNLNQTRIK